VNESLVHFEEEVKGKFVKCKEVEQNVEGDLFALAYIDDGTFKIRTFNIPINHSKENLCLIPKRTP